MQRDQKPWTIQQPRTANWQQMRRDDNVTSVNITGLNGIALDGFT